VKVVLFACVHNAGRSQMAAAFFNQLADPTKARAISAGTEPGSRVHREVVDAMRELGVDLSVEQPRRLTDELTQTANMLVTMGCGEACPVLPGIERDDWPLEDPKGRPMGRVREIRNEVEARVRELLAARDWLPGTIRSARPDDRPAAEALLRAACLPVEGVNDHFDAFFIAEDRSVRAVGVAGLEIYGSVALLRSVAVEPSARSQGLGSALVWRALTNARERGVQEVYLLTTTASGFFEKQGFERVERSRVPSSVTKSSVEFTGACPDTATVMLRQP
jgi:arsenate reductase